MKRKLVVVDWIDSHSTTGGLWKRITEIEDDLRDASRCRSVGWVASDNKETLVLVAHLSNDDGEHVPFAGGDISIPKKCITKTTVLKEGR